MLNTKQLFQRRAALSAKEKIKRFITVIRIPFGPQYFRPNH